MHGNLEGLCTCTSVKIRFPDSFWTCLVCKYAVHFICCLHVVISPRLKSQRCFWLSLMSLIKAATKSIVEAAVRTETTYIMVGDHWDKAAALSIT